MSLRLRSSTWPNRTRHDDFQILEGEKAVGRLFDPRARRTKVALDDL